MTLTNLGLLLPCSCSIYANYNSHMRMVIGIVLYWYFMQMITWTRNPHILPHKKRTFLCGFALLCLLSLVRSLLLFTVGFFSGTATASVHASALLISVTISQVPLPAPKHEEPPICGAPGWYHGPSCVREWWCRCRWCRTRVETISLFLFLVRFCRDGDYNHNLEGQKHGRSLGSDSETSVNAKCGAKYVLPTQSDQTLMLSIETTGHIGFVVSSFLFFFFFFLSLVISSFLSLLLSL